MQETLESLYGIGYVILIRKPMPNYISFAILSIFMS